MWCNHFTEYIKRKLMIPISQVTNPKLSKKKKKSNKPPKNGEWRTCGRKIRKGVVGGGENESESLREGGVAVGREIERKGGRRQRGWKWEWE